MFGLSVGAVVVLCVLCVALFTRFGARILRPLLKVAAVLVAAYLLYLWFPRWGPVVEPVASDVAGMIRNLWSEAMAGPR